MSLSDAEARLASSSDTPAASITAFCARVKAIMTIIAMSYTVLQEALAAPPIGVVRLGRGIHVVKK